MEKKTYESPKCCIIEIEKEALLAASGEQQSSPESYNNSVGNGVWHAPRRGGTWDESEE